MNEHTYNTIMGRQYDITNMNYLYNTLTYISFTILIAIVNSFSTENYLR